MNAHVLQHVPFETIGCIEPWLTERKARIGYTRFFEPWTLPDPAEVDLILAMGGPMSVNDEAELPWLAAEKQFLREAMGRGVAILGICLGAQLIASAAGARVYRAPQREIGWFDIQGLSAGAGVFSFPGSVRVFHWHGETFDLPAGAVHLARSAVCENQAFQLGARVLGLQFHLETTPQTAGALLAHCGHELEGGGEFVQSAAQLRAAPLPAYETVNACMDQVLAYLTREL